MAPVGQHVASTKFCGIVPALFAGSVSGALLIGALLSQYVGGLAPCEMCLWQRWPHLAAAAIGIGGGLLLRAGIILSPWGRVVAILAVLGLATSGAIGVFHAGVEWKWWEGPTACTGTLLPKGGNPADLPFRIIRCDEAQWRLFGISLAGYNAVISLAAAGVAIWLMQRRKA